jgi:hypothetical protein
MWELTLGRTWRPLLELRGQADPATEPVLALLLARASEAVGDAAGAEALLRRSAVARALSFMKGRSVPFSPDG